MALAAEVIFCGADVGQIHDNIAQRRKNHGFVHPDFVTRRFHKCKHNRGGKMLRTPFMVTGDQSMILISIPARLKVTAESSTKKGARP